MIKLKAIVPNKVEGLI